MQLLGIQRCRLLGLSQFFQFYFTQGESNKSRLHILLDWFKFATVWVGEVDDTLLIWRFPKALFFQKTCHFLTIFFGTRQWSILSQSGLELSKYPSVTESDIHCPCRFKWINLTPASAKFVAADLCQMCNEYVFCICPLPLTLQFFKNCTLPLSIVHLHSW